MALDTIMALFDPFGTSWGSSLSWSQSAALETLAENTRPGANRVDIEPLRLELQNLRQDVHEVTKALAEMENDLGLRLDGQTRVLDQQLEILKQILETLQNPLSTRAAERVRVATELLRHQRYSRAAAVAEEAITDDPNNDLAFIVAGWASFGLGQIERARDYFREARQATSGPDANTGARHAHAAILAARLTLALEGAEAALNELREAQNFTVLGSERVHAFAFLYDRAVYQAASGHAESAIEDFARAATRGFCLLALTDPVLSQHKEILDSVREHLVEILAQIDRVKNGRRKVQDKLHELQAVAAEHQLATPPVEGLSVAATYSSEALSGLLNGRTKGELAGLLEHLAEDFKKVELAVGHDPGIDREIARERALAAALKKATAERHTEVLFQGRIDAILARKGFNRDEYRYLVARPEKPNVVVMTYILEDLDAYHGLQQGLQASRDRPGKSPLSRWLWVHASSSSPENDELDGDTLKPIYDERIPHWKTDGIHISSQTYSWPSGSEWPPDYDIHIVDPPN